MTHYLKVYEKRETQSSMQAANSGVSRELTNLRPSRHQRKVFRGVMGVRGEEWGVLGRGVVESHLAEGGEGCGPGDGMLGE